MGRFGVTSPHMLGFYAVLVVALINFIIPVVWYDDISPHQTTQANCQITGAIFSIVAGVLVILYSLVEKLENRIVKIFALALLAISAILWTISGGMWTYDDQRPQAIKFGYGGAAAFSFIGLMLNVLISLLFLQNDAEVGQSSVNV